MQMLFNVSAMPSTNMPLVKESHIAKLIIKGHRNIVSTIRGALKFLVKGYGYWEELFIGAINLLKPQCQTLIFDTHLCLNPFVTSVIIPGHIFFLMIFVCFEFLACIWHLMYTS